jgi:peptide/nickel transport system permease protein
MEAVMDRVTYIISRLLQLIPTIIIVMVLVFFLVRLIPGNPAQLMLGILAKPEDIVRFSKAWGLDQPIYIQFGVWLSNLLRGDLGESLVMRVPISQILAARLPVTLFMTFYAVAIAIVTAIPLAIISAFNKDSWIDQLIRGLNVTILSTPTFWIGILLLIAFAVKIPLFKIGGVGPTFKDRLSDLFLPAVTLALNMSSTITRNLRDGLISMLNSDHVVFARAKGLSERKVIIGHVLRNALIPTTTLIGIYLSWMIGGSMIIESVFGVPGIGSMMIQGVLGRDYPIVQILTLVYALFVSLIYLITDLIYSFLDPRVGLS